MFFKSKNFLFISIIFAITLVFALRIFIYFQEKEEEKQIMQFLNVKTIKIDAWLKNKKSLLEKLSKNLTNVKYEKKTFLELMYKTNEQMGTNSTFGGFNNGQYFDTQGYWIEGFDPRVRPWYIETLKNNKTTILGPMYYNDISGQTISWWSVSSVFYKNKKLFGVISGEILPDMIVKHLKNSYTNNLESLFLFHKETGIIVSAINRNKELKYFQNLYSIKSFQKVSKSKENKIYFSYKNLNKVAFIHALNEAPWVLCVIKDN